jgi:dTDP-glucose pyrophosphorylase
MRDKSEKIRNIQIDEQATILQAMQKMDAIGHKLLIVTRGGRFLSLLSIGDIQRAIMKFQTFEKQIGQILRSRVSVGSTTDARQELSRLMIENRTEFMPILDPGGELVDVLFWEDLVEQPEEASLDLEGIPVVIMAGGKGTRLKPITNIIPKPLIPLGEKPIIEIIANQFRRSGVKQYFISINYKGDMIRKYFDDLKDRNYQVDYINEDQPLGTIGSIYLLKGKLTNTFFVSNCDILVDQDYGDVYRYHRENKNELTIVSAIKSYQIPYGTIEAGENGLLTSLKEKPELVFQINSGVYILEPHLIDEVPAGEFFHITSLIEKIKQRGGRVGVFPVSENAWIDIGEWKEYEKAQHSFQSRFAHLS